MEIYIPETVVPSSSSSDDKRVFKEEWLPGNFRWTSAVISGREGLTLIYQSGNKYHGVKFRHATCGFEGTGPQTTADILELAGFGDKDELYQTVSHRDAGYLVLAK